MTALRRLDHRLRAWARGRVSATTCFGYFLLAALVLAAAVGVGRASASAPTCTSVGISVAPLHGTRFYVDSSSSPVLDSGYTGVSISPAAARSNIWVQVTNFAGGALGLDANQPAAAPLGNLTAASTTPAYFFLTASPVADNTTAQTFDVNVYQGDPARGGAQLCTFADGYGAGVYNTIQASANKIQDVTGDSVASTVSTSSPVVGATVTLSVEGTTGTLGNGPDGTPFVYETPTSLSSWPAGSFRLVGTTLTLSPGASQTVYTNQLQISNSAFSAAQSYIAQYTFRITGTTASATTPYPIQEISSGTQVKHTNTSSLSAIPAIQAASNTITLNGAASTAALPAGGGTVTYTATLHSTSSTVSTVDQIVDTLPAGATYAAGTAKLDGSVIADPTSSGGTLVFPGPFSISSAADRTLTFDVTLPASAGTYTNSVVGYVASTQIDTTTSTGDSAPATSATTVAGAAQTITFAQPADTRVDQGPVSLSASASSGLSVGLASTTPGVCTVSSSSATLLSVGACTITASQAGNGLYAAAASVSRSFQVTAAPVSQTIAFAQPADTRLDQGPVALAATATSGLAVGFTSNTPGICTVTGSSVSLASVGTCTVAASQAGNGTFAAAPTVARSFSVTALPLAQSITFAQPADIRLDQGPVTLSASASSGLAVAFASSTTGVCTAAAATVTLVSVGTCTIVASQGGNATYSAATPFSRSFAVTAALLTQTITFAQPPDTAVDQGPVAVFATASSGLAASITSATTGVCTVSAAAVTLVAAGTCSLTASQAGDAAYAAAIPVTRSFVVLVSLLPQTVAFAQLSDIRVDGGPVSLTASATSGLAVSFASTSTGICTVSGSVVTLVAPGTCTVTAGQAGDAVYAAAAPVSRSFAVAPLPLTQAISFAQPADTQIDQGPRTLAASASSGLAVSFASSTPSVCTISGSAATLAAVGVCTITASQAGDTTYAAALPVTKSFAVNAAPAAPLTQTIAFTQPPDTRVDQGPLTVVATATSSLAVSFASSTPAVCTVSGSSVVLVAAGSCTVVASQAGDPIYAPAPDVSRSFQVAPAPAPQTISFLQPADTRVDAGPVAVSATSSSALPVAFASTTSGVCTVSGSSVSLVASGTCSIVASQAGDSSYASATDATRTFQVTPAILPQTIAFGRPGDTRVDEGPVALQAAATSGLAVALSSATPGVCTVSATSALLLAVGTCTISAAQAGDAAYSAASTVTRSFEVVAAPQTQTIGFAQPADIRVDQGPVTLDATATSGLAVTLASNTVAVCTVSGATVTLSAAGTCTVTASQAGNASFVAAIPVTRSFVVTAAPAGSLPQTITFTQLGDAQVGDAAITLTASASSGLALTFGTTTPSICSVAGSGVALLGAGTCTIVASQPGDAAYSAAPDVARSFDVTLSATPPPAFPPVSAPDPPAPAPAPAPAQAPAPPAQTIVFLPLPEISGPQTALALGATATSGLPVAFESVTPTICSITGEAVDVLGTGMCTIVAHQAGNGIWPAASDVRETFAVVAPPLPAPTSRPARTTAGETTQAIVTGIPATATLALDGTPTLPAIVALRLVGARVVVTPAKTFSGVVEVPVIVTDGGRTVRTRVSVVVRPKAPTEIAVRPTDSSATRIAWHSSSSATGYEVRIDGKIVCRTSTDVCVVHALVPPSSTVVVTSLGNAGTRSVDARAAYALDHPVLIAIVHFASDSSRLVRSQRHILTATQAKIDRGGFTHAILMCHTDNAGSFAYNLALSAARCRAVARYVRRKLGIAHVSYRQSAYAYLRPAAPNTTRRGRAANRRVELYVR